MLYLYNDMGQQQKTIYLIDDDDDDRFLIREAVEEEINNVKIIEFNNGIDFLDQLSQSAVAFKAVLVLLDINMPRMNGLEVISRLRSEPKNTNLQILAISTASSPELIKEIYATGASGYFTKPDSLKGISELAQNIKKYFIGLPI